MKRGTGEAKKRHKDIKLGTFDAELKKHKKAIQIMANKLGMMDRSITDDLYIEGMVGFHEAYKGFRPETNNYLWTYASRIVYGRMRDYLRDIDYVPRLTRLRFKKRRLMEEELGTADPEIVRKALKWTKEHYDDSFILKKESLNQKIYETDTNKIIEKGAGLIATPIEHPVDRISRINETLRGFSAREKTFIRLYFWEDWTMKEIGVSFGFSESRVSQIFNGLFIRLRETGDRVKDDLLGRIPKHEEVRKTSQRITSISARKN